MWLLQLYFDIDGQVIVTGTQAKVAGLRNQQGFAASMAVQEGRRTMLTCKLLLNAVAADCGDLLLDAVTPNCWYLLYSVLLLSTAALYQNFKEYTEGDKSKSWPCCCNAFSRKVLNTRPHRAHMLQCSIPRSTVSIHVGEGDRIKQTLFFLAFKQAAKVDKLLVGDVLIIDAHPLTLSAEEVGGINGACAAAVDCIKALPAPKTCLMRVTLHLYH